MSTENQQSKELVLQLLSLLRANGKDMFHKAADDGRRKLELRSLRKDRNKMYEKLGREVERLVEGGEVHHPGLIKGVERIAKLQAKIAEMQKNELTSTPEK